jgi:hypothetical protein
MKKISPIGGNSPWLQNAPQRAIVSVVGPAADFASVESIITDDCSLSFRFAQDNVG